MLQHHRVWLENHPERSSEWFFQQLAQGFQVHHVDGDHSNNDPQNLVLIEFRDHMRLHGIGRLSFKAGHMSAIGKRGVATRRAWPLRKRQAIARNAAKARWKASDQEKLSTLDRRTRAKLKRVRKQRKIIQQRYRAKVRAKKLMYAPRHSTVSATSANEDRAVSASERGRPAKRRVPWYVPPHLLKRRAKAARLKRKGIRPLTKAQARELIRQTEAGATTTQRNSSARRMQ